MRRSSTAAWATVGFATSTTSIATCDMGRSVGPRLSVGLGSWRGEAAGVLGEAAVGRLGVDEGGGVVAQRGGGNLWRGRRWRRGGIARSAVRVLRTPKLNDPVLVCAFEGWNDAGEAASEAVAALASCWRALPFAEIDAEEFFDFTEARPEVVGTPEGGRRIVWPSTTLSIATTAQIARDVVLLRGPEPQLRWPTYAETVVGLVRDLGIGEVVLLGAYLSEVAHTRPVPLSGTASSPWRLETLGVEPSAYEGPTGIVGVLAEAFAASGAEVVSLWASVPCYSVSVSPKAALALVRALGHLLGQVLDEDELARQAEDYERRMDELVAGDENLAAYVARLEEMDDTGVQGVGEGLAEEIERYLRRRS
jgi:proteasome assembly chaperone (PAC2) family protein